MSRSPLVVGLAALLALTVGLGTADAHKRKYARQTTVVFEELPGSTGDRLSGQVALGAPQDPLDPGAEPLSASAAGGGAAACLKGQTVEIRHRIFAAAAHPYAAQDRGDLVATTTTDANGFWQSSAYEASAANQLLFDQFSVEVVKKRLPPKNERHKHVCLGTIASRTVFSY